MNRFEDFFTDIIEYPRGIGDSEILPFGTLFTYISGTFLNGFINYAGIPLRAYLLDRYRHWDDVEEGSFEVSVQEPPNSYKWVKQSFDTKAALYSITIQAGRLCHTDIGMFRDDVIALFKTEGRIYWFFWFDNDISDCCIGRFRTELSEVEVIELFRIYVNERNASCRDAQGGEPRILPPHFFTGWMKF